jgi:hypothetical protein
LFITPLLNPLPFTPTLPTTINPSTPHLKPRSFSPDPHLPSPPKPNPKTTPLNPHLNPTHNPTTPTASTPANPKLTHIPAPNLPAELTCTAVGLRLGLALTTPPPVAVASVTFNPKPALVGGTTDAAELVNAMVSAALAVTLPLATALALAATLALPVSLTPRLRLVATPRLVQLESVALSLSLSLSVIGQIVVDTEIVSTVVLPTPQDVMVGGQDVIVYVDVLKTVEVDQPQVDSLE